MLYVQLSYCRSIFFSHIKFQALITFTFTQKCSLYCTGLVTSVFVLMLGKGAMDKKELHITKCFDIYCNNCIILANGWRT